MKKIIFSLVLTSLFSSPAMSATAPTNSFTKCTAGSSDNKSCKSRAKRKAIAKAKCEALPDDTQKSECLIKIEDDAAAKKAAESANDKKE